MNAIILAAGMGTRLGYISKKTPKPLVNIGGISIIERQIKYIKQRGISDIYIVTGYMHDCFLFLEKKYGAKCLYNPMFNRCNNIFSLHIAIDYFSDSLILEGDVFMTTNFIKENHYSSTYYTGIKSKADSEWQLEFDEAFKVTKIIIPVNRQQVNSLGKNGYIIAGISYWNSSSAEIIKASLEEKINTLCKDSSSYIKDFFWDHLVVENLPLLNINAQIINNRDWYEIDNINDYNAANAIIASGVLL